MDTKPHRSGTRLSLCFLLLLIVFGETASLAAQANDASERGPVRQQTLRRSEKPDVLQQAYTDVYSILQRPNRCSAFFGGPNAALVLQQLVPRVSSVSMGNELWVRMSGSYALAYDVSRKFGYRLIDKVEINLDGAFYSSAPKLNASIPGGMHAGTREIRAVALLHELGHLIQGPDGKWLLPDDGDNFYRSNINTERVLRECRADVRSATSLSFDAATGQSP